MTRPEKRPVGYFVHHQGRGHAERCAAVVNALPADQPVTVFCAKTDIFPPFTRSVDLIKLPSLFEPTGAEDINDHSHTPDTVHCAPLGWPGIRTAMATMAQWFATANPILMISDVSAEIAQLARLCSVPHVKVLQHGLRNDPAHQAAYDGAVGLLCPNARGLAQSDWPERHLRKTHFAGGLGVAVDRPDTARRKAARDRFGLRGDAQLIVVMSGGGGTGFSSAPLGIGARATPEATWITIGKIQEDWHATEPENLLHHGWVDSTQEYLAAADLIVASTGNTTCQQILASETPWLAIPEWRYFDEQVEKARVLQHAGAAHFAPSFPSSAGHWRSAIAQTLADHDPAKQRRLIDENAAERTALWLGDLIDRLTPKHLLKGQSHDPIREVSGA